MEMRSIPDPMWSPDDVEGETGLVERLETRIEDLHSRLGRLERRQQRFGDMIRLLLALHDQTEARLTALDGGLSDDETESLPRDTARVTDPEGIPRPTPRRRAALRRVDS